MPHLITRGGQRPIELYLGHCRSKLIILADQSLEEELMATGIHVHNAGRFVFVIEYWGPK